MLATRNGGLVSPRSRYREALTLDPLSSKPMMRFAFFNLIWSLSATHLLPSLLRPSLSPLLLLLLPPPLPIVLAISVRCMGQVVLVDLDGSKRSTDDDLVDGYTRHYATMDVIVDRATATSPLPPQDLLL